MGTHVDYGRPQRLIVTTDFGTWQIRNTSNVYYGIGGRPTASALWYWRPTQNMRLLNAQFMADIQNSGSAGDTTWDLEVWRGPETVSTNQMFGASYDLTTIGTTAGIHQSFGVGDLLNGNMLIDADGGETIFVRGVFNYPTTTNDGSNIRHPFFICEFDVGDDA